MIDVDAAVADEKVMALLLLVAVVEVVAEVVPWSSQVVLVRPLADHSNSFLALDFASKQVAAPQKNDLMHYFDQYVLVPDQMTSM